MDTRNRNELKEIFVVNGLIIGLVFFAFVGTIASQLLTA